MPNFGPMQGVADVVQGWQQLPQRALNAVARPGGMIQRGIQGAEQMLGIPLSAPEQAPVDTSWHDSMVQGANQSFQHPPVQPRRMMPMRGR